MKTVCEGSVCGKCRLISPIQFGPIHFWPAHMASQFGPIHFCCVVLCCVVLWLVLVCVLCVCCFWWLFVVVCCCFLWFVLVVWLLVWTTLRRTSPAGPPSAGTPLPPLDPLPPPDGPPKMSRFFAVSAPIFALFVSHCVLVEFWWFL